MTDWISVKDELPKEGQTVLIVIDERYWRQIITIASIEPVTGWTGFDGRSIPLNITHWMPLPALPETEGGT